MGMNDEETAALIAGGHTFGKAHGAADASRYVGVEPEGGEIEAQGFGWKNSYGSGDAADTITSGLEGAWTFNPAAWTHNFLENLYGYEWEQTRSPGGAIQWRPAGGANGARVRLAPQREWAANDPAELGRVLETLAGVQSRFNAGQTGGKRVSLADVIVLGGAAAIERAAENGGHDVTVHFRPGRTDASAEQTDAQSFAPLEPTADGSAHGVFTDRPGTLSNDFFVNLIDMSTQWTRSSTEGVYEGRDRGAGELRWTATPVDLIFGSHSELRAVAEYYASDDAQDDFVHDFVAAWTKVMTLDRFDLP